MTSSVKSVREIVISESTCRNQQNKGRRCTSSIDMSTTSSTSTMNPFQKQKRARSKMVKTELKETLVLNNSFRNKLNGPGCNKTNFSKKDAKKIAKMLNKYDEGQKFEELFDAEFIPTELKTTCIKNNVSAVTILPFLAANEELWNYRFLLQMGSYLARNHVLSASWENIKFLVKQAEGILDQVLNDPRVVCKLIEKKTLAMLQNTSLVNNNESTWKIWLDSLFVNLSRYFDVDNTTEKKLQRKHVQDKIQCQLLKKDFELNRRNHFERISVLKSVVKRREENNLISFDDTELNLDDLSSAPHSSCDTSDIFDDDDSTTKNTSDDDQSSSEDEENSENNSNIGLNVSDSVKSRIKSINPRSSSSVGSRSSSSSTGSNSSISDFSRSRSDNRSIFNSVVDFKDNISQTNSKKHSLEVINFDSELTITNLEKFNNQPNSDDDYEEEILPPLEKEEEEEDEILPPLEKDSILHFDNSQFNNNNNNNSQKWLNTQFVDIEKTVTTSSTSKYNQFSNSCEF